ncbi:MAG: glycoside hydrolase 43 family protein [Prevotellaceae bacterium]|jgi:beta-xylosidase|nr:glycoside hydrolase 43 family protein [Prevotellaceae bacterium]
MNRKILFTLFVFHFALLLTAQTYKNPVIHADYSDPDVCRVGDDYYMTASSFNCIPGLPVLHSKDLVHWELVNYALPVQKPLDFFNKPQHGNGVWAPSIRFHNGEFYIYWGNPDFGLYMMKASDPRGEWSEPVMVKEGKGLIDCCPFWDEDGNAYISFAFAGSRAGNKSVLLMSRLSADGTRAIGESRIVFDGKEKHPTVEGTKLYKRNGYYYIFAPAGGVATGWQLVLRSKNIWGPYEEKIVLAQGNTNINGPHQGAWVDTPSGEDWFIHFQDKGAYGRIVHLQPMVWKEDGFPIMGNNGEPVREWKIPKTKFSAKPNTSNLTFAKSQSALPLEWQWHANPQLTWLFNDIANNHLRLYSVFTDSVRNLWDVPNLLLQKFPAEEFTVTAKMTFTPDARYTGERAGFVVMGEDYALISIENTRDGLIFSQRECMQAHKGNEEKINAFAPTLVNSFYVKLEVRKNAVCHFSYSLDGVNFNEMGNAFTAKAGRWIGAKFGFFCQRPKWSNDGGWLDVSEINVTQTLLPLPD